jgi:hypothetical protein
MNNHQNHYELRQFKLFKLFQLFCSIDPLNVRPILGSFSAVSGSQKFGKRLIPTSDNLRSSFLVRVFGSLKVHTHTITVFVGFTLDKIDSFDLLK